MHRCIKLKRSRVWSSEECKWDWLFATGRCRADMHWRQPWAHYQRDQRVARCVINSGYLYWTFALFNYQGVVGLALPFYGCCCTPLPMLILRNGHKTFGRLRTGKIVPNCISKIVNGSKEGLHLGLCLCTLRARKPQALCFNFLGTRDHQRGTIGI